MKKTKKEKIKIITWKGNLHVASMILNSSQNSKSKEWAYQEIMKAAKILDQLIEGAKNDEK